MFKKLVYIEKRALAHPSTTSIINRLGQPAVVEIAHYKDVLNVSPSAWRIQKQVQKIVLALRTEDFFYKGSAITPDFGFKHFYYNTLVLNCVYDCDYCYLQGMFNTPHLVLFVNNEDFFAATEKLLKQINEQVYMALSYDTDLPAVEHLYPYCSEWLTFCAQHPLFTAEIRTKSNNITPFLKSPVVNNVILAWSLSPTEVVKWHERAAPSLSARLKAIQQVLSHGWRVRICFDPLLYLPEWKKIYRLMIEQIIQYFSLHQIDSFSLGVFRMNADFLKRMRQQRQDSGVLLAKFERNKDIVTYEMSIKQEMTEYMEQLIRQYSPNARIDIV